MVISESQYSRLLHQHKTIAELLNGIPETTLKAEIIPCKWNIWQNAVHLVAYEPTFLQRINLMAAGSHPTFKRYNADDDELFASYQQLPLSDLLKKSNEVRQQIAAKVLSLNAAELQFKGCHKKYGELRIVDWLEFYLLHEAHHLFTMFMLKNQ
jgi:uncharacterized damage-inducible protein DinB